METAKLFKLIKEYTPVLEMFVEHSLLIHNIEAQGEIFFVGENLKKVWCPDSSPGRFWLLQIESDEGCVVGWAHSSKAKGGTVYDMNFKKGCFDGQSVEFYEEDKIRQFLDKFVAFMHERLQDLLLASERHTVR